MLGLGLSTFAQGPTRQTAEERAKSSVEALTKSLSLTPEQQEKILAASLERGKSFQALRESAGEGNRPDREKMEVINKKYNDTLESVLNADQKVKWEEVKKQMGPGGQGQRQRPQ